MINIKDIIRKYIDKRKYYKSIFDKYYYLLKPGIYLYYSNDKPCLYSIEYCNVRFISEKALNDNTNLLSTFFILVKSLLFVNFKLEKCSNKYSIIMMTANNYKLFDLTNKKVITFNNSFDTNNEFSHYYSKLSPFFNNTNLRFSIDGNYIIEDYIEFSKNMLSKSDISIIICCLFNNYYNFYKTIKGHTKQYICKHDLIKKCDFIKCFIPEIYETLLESTKCIDKVRILPCHKDFHFENIMMSNGEIYFIDWEYCGQTIFFFDYINYIFFQIINNNDFDYLHKYLEGDFDDLWERNFSILNEVYNKEKKDIYVLLYLIEKLDCDLKNLHYKLQDGIFDKKKIDTLIAKLSRISRKIFDIIFTI